MSQISVYLKITLRLLNRSRISLLTEKARIADDYLGLKKVLLTRLGIHGWLFKKHLRIQRGMQKIFLVHLKQRKISQTLRHIYV